MNPYVNINIFCYISQCLKPKIQIYREKYWNNHMMLNSGQNGFSCVQQNPQPKFNTKHSGGILTELFL